MKEIFKKIFIAVFFSVIWLLPSDSEIFRTQLYLDALLFVISLLPVLIIKNRNVSIPISLALCAVSCFIYKDFIFYYAPITCITCLNSSRTNIKNNIQAKKSKVKKQKPNLIFVIAAVSVVALQIFFTVDFISFLTKYSYSLSALKLNIDRDSLVWIFLFLIILLRLIYSFKYQSSDDKSFIYSQKFVSLSAFLFLLKSMQSFLMEVSYSSINERFAFYGWLIYISLLLKEKDFALNEPLSHVKKIFKIKVTE